jgi:peptidyl-prolyl cis-trans isomerase D
MRSFILGTIIVLACLAFIFTGFGSLHLSNLSGLNPNMAATVGSQEIGMSQFSNQLANQGVSRYPESEQKSIALRILNQMIGQKILVEQAQKIGWKASDSEIAVLIRTVPFFQDPATKQFSMEKFKGYIASQQMSDVDFYNELRSELELQKMQNLLFMPETLSHDIVTAQYAINNTQFSFQYVLIDPSESLIQDQITDKANKFLSDPKNQSQLQSIFQTQKSKFESPAQVKVQSILVAYKTATRAQGEALARTKEQALAFVQELDKKLKSGANFTKLATAKNDDLIAKQNQGSLGFVDNTNIDPISAKSVLALTQKNPLSGIVDTPFGYRLFAYQDSKKAVHKTFDEVKLDLARQVVADQIKLDVKTNLNAQIVQALSAHNISKLNQIMSDFKMSWKYASKPYKVTDSYISELGNTSDLAQNIFRLKKPGDLIFNVINFGNGKSAVIKLVSRTDPATASEQDLNALKKQIVTSNSSDFAQTVQKNLMARYQKEGSIAINPAIKGY